MCTFHKDQLSHCIYIHVHDLFRAGESPMGPVVKLIMDHPRCTQLQEGDVILEVNGENVQEYPHSELVTVLKRCPKGNQASFFVLRYHENEVCRVCDGISFIISPSSFLLPLSLLSFLHSLSLLSFLHSLSLSIYCRAFSLLPLPSPLCIFYFLS